MAIIEGKNISVTIARKKILSDISLSLPQGQRTAIIGPNGSGKSTLLKALCGLIAYQGQVFLQGSLIKQLKRSELAKRLAILPQSLQVPADVTVFDLVEHGRFPHRTWWKAIDSEDKNCIDWALKQTNIEHLQERLVNTLSGGERQRAWIAMALAQKPEILLLDEPTTYLDICHQLEILQLLTRLNQENNLTVVMVIHDLNQALQFADNVLVMKEGQIIVQGKPESIINVELLRQVFSVESEAFISSQGQKIISPLRSV